MGQIDLTVKNSWKGKTKTMDHSEKAAQVRNAATAKIKEIQADTGLSDLGKGQQIRELREKANKEIGALRDKHLGDINGKRDSLLSQLFGLGHRITASETEKTLTIMSFRDALFRAGNFENPGEALRVLQRPSTASDPLLAKAIATIAYEKDWGGVLDAYANDSEDTASALGELRALETRSSGQRFQQNMAFTLISEVPEERAARVADHSGTARHEAPSAA